MIRTLLLLALAATPVLSPAQAQSAAQADFVSLDGKVLPSGNPIEPNPDVKLVLHFQKPVLWLFRTHSSAPRGTVIVCPGGAYCALEMKNEGENTARYLNDLGFDAAVLEYHIASGAKERDLALDDAVQAVRLLKSRASDLGMHSDQVDLMGYSAGGHLAARTAQKLGVLEQPDALILVYPAYLDEKTADGTGPAVNPPSKPGRLFALIGDKDNPLWIQGCETYAQAWKKAGGAATFCLLPNGGHGFGMTAKSADSTGQWAGLLKAFLDGMAPAPASAAETTQK